MSPLGATLGSALRRTRTVVGTLFIIGLFVLAGGSAALYSAVHHTAQPEFCNSCHIMEPYYQSWVDSPHSKVACIECHYEPGTVETLEGKFKALSQLAKYVTRTQGTKPWAEVSDASCMRSGCHSVRMIEGPVKFGDINFDHRHHLLESRRGRRLRCVSCHSQIVQGEHVSVTASVCITCHFMPDEHGQVPEKSSDCLTCHGPPDEAVLVAGRPFVHADYVERGVDCRDCHDPVVVGDGTVRKERCHSCHAEVGHIERRGETEFLHEKHVTEHKVECFECHDEIHHGLLPLERPERTRKDGCGSCHANTHDAAGMMLAGTGAAGVEDSPSRMFQTRVGCGACHTGRSGFHVREALAESGGDEPSAVRRFLLSPSPGDGIHGASIAAAGNVDCIHCHGPAFDGMLGEWQAAVGEQLERLKPMLGDLEQRVAADPTSPAKEPLEEARTNLALVAFDGSRGAHNVGYALDALRAGAERIDRARTLLGLEGETPATAGFPFASADGCTTCHAGAGRSADVWPAEAAFPHARHLANGMDCSACHQVAEPGTPAHGRPSFPRADCASCHHQESESFDASDCTSCHSTQASVLAGVLGDMPARPGPMAAMECWECHGEAPDVMRPPPAACVLCHEPGYDQMLLDWKAAVNDLATQLEEAIAAAHAAGGSGPALDQARAALRTARADGSGGAHNFDLVRDLLTGALQGLKAD